MATSQISEVIQHLRRTVLLRDGAGVTDGQLLEGFISRRDETALATLVRRHGPMVWSVCRRVLRNYHDAEDTFQATFLVLPNLAPAVMKDLLVAWLSPEADGGRVCNRCGLEYPRHRVPPVGTWKLLPGKQPGVGPPPIYDLPELFHACPGCSASRYDCDWPQLVTEHHHAWKELDGYVGQPQDGGAGAA